MSDDATLYQAGDDQRQSRDMSLRGRRPPSRVPGYELERFLGAGAYGEVWLAVDRNTRRQVAVKFYAHRGGLDWSLLAREVEKLSFMFADRRVVQLLGVGWDADPPYYVMEFLERGSLEDRLQSGPLATSEAIELFHELALALAHSHAKGLLHCDLKPANILFGADGKPRLADFGQSRLSHEQTPALGTLFYMAPEQADLAAVPHVRWDVYALGAILYRMLVGAPPFRGPSSAAALESASDIESRLAAYRQQLTAAPAPTAHRHVPGVDRALAEIVERCLERQPERRYPNVQSVLDALEQRRLRRARRPLLVLGALGPALLLAVMSAFAWSGYTRAVAESRAAVLARATEGNRFAAEFVAEAVARKIERRWELLEQAADDQQLRDLLAAAQDATAIDDPRRQALQQYVRGSWLALDPAQSNWFLCSATGRQLVRIPEDAASIGKDFSYRDYFHGLGRDLPAVASGIVPIQGRHLSIVFKGKASGLQLVAFSVPIWSASSTDIARRVVGVLCMSAPLGSFAELHGDQRATTTAAQFAVLVDLRPDEQGRAGILLEHPGLVSAAPATDLAPPKHYVPDDELPRLTQATQFGERAAQARNDLARAQRPAADGPSALPGDDFAEQLRAAESELGSVDFVLNHRDQLPGFSDQPWLAAIRPVLVNDEFGDIEPTGWVVLVQERLAHVTQAVDGLADRLVRRSLTALGVVLGLVTGLWGFVVTLLNESPQAGWLARVRRRLGLAGETTHSGGTISAGQAPARLPPAEVRPTAPADQGKPA